MKNKRRFRKADIRDVMGSGFAGYLEASYSDLVQQFGEPHWRNDGPREFGDGKVRCEWGFKIGSGKDRLVFTIYDYKEKKPVEQVSLWHIGSKGAVHRLVEIFAIETVSLSKPRWAGMKSK